MHPDAASSPGSASTSGADRSRSFTAFRRRDLSAVTQIVREVTASGDPGMHGHGVEVVLESPRRRWWRRIIDRSARDRARIAVTGESGAVGYPIHVRLVTGFGAGATRRVDRRDGWATSVTTVAPASAGHPRAAEHPAGAEAILMLKRGSVPGFEPVEAAAEVVEGTVAALADLHPFSPDRGWRAWVDRDILRR
jgi:hypothetical protein